MHRFHRPHAAQVAELLQEPEPRLIVAVTGPRQTGKTTLVRQALKRARLPWWYVAVDDPQASSVPAWSASSHDEATIRSSYAKPDADWLLGVWEQARVQAGLFPDGFVLALDEIQHIDNWSGLVKGLWDRDRAEGRRLQVVISGSAPWSMLTGVNESLVGRIMPVPVRQWSLDEMASAFDFTLDDYLFFGGYPGAARLKSDLVRWREFIVNGILGPVTGRDIVSWVRVDKPALMRSLMAMVSGYSGQIMSFGKMVGQLDEAGNTTTVADYLHLLSDAGLAAGLSRYSPRPHLTRASSPKLNALDSALVTALSGHDPASARADTSFWGRLVETVVGAHLHNARTVGTQLHYWRDKDREVDFVLSGGSHLLGIEVKSGSKLRSLGGMERFKERFPGARTLVVGPTEAVGRKGVPLNEFLSESADYWLREG